ncbi:MAG TPA: amidohydrolase family protein [candidate division Zixibacteria bacterium]|nr:amidohydrolase family protein [candidate division Zixibacteria bacterium]
MEEIIISADSHVIEVPDLWEKRLPPALRDRAPRLYFDEGRDAWMFGSPEIPAQAVGGLFMAGQRAENIEHFRRAGFAVARAGGWDTAERMKDMEQDGVSAEVLYPSLGLGLYCIKDAALQEALFRTYNDWLIEFCAGAPDRLFGIALISMYDVDHAVAELERCKKNGMVGSMIWQAPDPELPFTSPHYERFWAASQDLEMPVHLHILTGFGDSMHRQTAHGMARYRIGVNQTREIEDALFDIIFSGVLERYPRLKVVSVENEIGWMPFWLGQCDKAYRRHRHRETLPIAREPGEYFARQVFATFFNDRVGGRLFSWWGTANCMWSNDYPHQNSTWPRSREVIARDLGHLPAADRVRLLSGNVATLYGLRVPETALRPSGNGGTAAAHA